MRIQTHVHSPASGSKRLGILKHLCVGPVGDASVWAYPHTCVFQLPASMVPKGHPASFQPDRSWRALLFALAEGFVVFEVCTKDCDTCYPPARPRGRSQPPLQGFGVPGLPGDRAPRPRYPRSADVRTTLGPRSTEFPKSAVRGHPRYPRSAVKCFREPCGPRTSAVSLLAVRLWPMGAKPSDYCACMLAHKELPIRPECR